jgi:hypothetical protein
LQERRATVSRKIETSPYSKFKTWEQIQGHRSGHDETALQEEQLNVAREDSASFEKDRVSILEDQSMGTVREATEEYLDETAPREEQLNVLREDSYI